MLMDIITTIDTRSSYRKKECQGERVLISGRKITEIKSTSVSISTKTRIVHPRVRTLIKTALLLTLDRRGLGT